MFPSIALLSFVLAAFSLGSTSATPPPVVVENSKFTLAFATRVNSTGFGSILTGDRARAKALTKKSGSAKGPSSFGVTNAAISYTAAVGVGSPPTTYTLLIDTGSSNTWIGARKKYVKTSTSKSTGKKINIDYGVGWIEGTEYIDQVTLSPSLVVKSQSIGVAEYSDGFPGVNGILGIGPVDLTNATVEGSKYVPTVTDNLLAQGTISSETIGMFYAPATSDSSKNGELTFGGIDTSKIKGDIKYVPITQSHGASQYWGIDQSITYGSETIMSSTSGVLDSGTTLILIPDDAYNKYQKATGAKYDNTTEMLTITPAQYKALKPLNFIIGGTTYTLTPNAQIWPRSLNGWIDGAPDTIYLAVASIGSGVGTGINFINGYPFLERFYAAYDPKNKRIGLGQTAFTTATTN